MSFVDIENAREKDQIQTMKKIIEAGHCPFCLKNLRKYHKKPILKETPLWLLTDNQWPYENTQLHLIAIYKKHATKIDQLADQAGDQLLQLISWAETKFNIPGGGIIMRFGDTNYSAGSVNHIHVQLVVPDLKKIRKAKKPVRIKIGKI